jgi:hypothetical protein
VARGCPCRSRYSGRSAPSSRGVHEHADGQEFLQSNPVQRAWLPTAGTLFFTCSPLYLLATVSVNAHRPRI